MAEFGGLVLGYAAGALSTLSPCVLPLLPIILVGAIEQHAWGPVALAAGLSASFAGVGTVLVSLGFSFGIDPTAFRLGAAALMLIIGIVLLVPTLQRRFALLAAPVAIGGQALIDRLGPSGIGGQFALGMLLGAIWTPCSGPTLGAAIGLAAQSETAGRAATVMAMFSLGAATPILALAYGSASDRGPTRFVGSQIAGGQATHGCDARQHRRTGPHRLRQGRRGLPHTCHAGLAGQRDDAAVKSRRCSTANKETPP
jgi:cytochrome c-type biogenesis protein